jgi:hypothetical protein
MSRVLAKVHNATPFNHRTEILRGDKTFNTKVPGAAVTVAGHHLDLAYALHGNSKPVSPAASPGGATTHR